MKTYSTREVADLAGVHRDTLLRWLRRGWVSEPARDFRGWRVFTHEQTMAIVAFARRLRDPSEETSATRNQLGLPFNREGGGDA